MARRIIPGGQNVQDPISNNTMLQRIGLIALKIFQVRNVLMYFSPNITFNVAGPVI